MAGKGPSGAVLPDLAMPTVLPTSHEKCPKSPGKRKYYNLVDAESAAAFSAQQYGKPMRAYVCDGCGLYHVTGKITYGDVTSSREDGTIVTAGMSTRPAWRSSNTLAPTPVERADMSEVIAMESPIVAGNKAAREKLLGEWLKGRESVTVPEVMEQMDASRYVAHSTLHALGWEGAKGQTEWYPSGKAPTPIKKVKPGKSVRGNPTQAALRASRKRKLAAYLVDHPEVATAEVMQLLGTGKDMAKSLLHELDWVPGHGNGARWSERTDNLVRTKKPERTLHAVESGDVDRFGRTQEEQTADPVEAAIERHPARGIHEPISSEDLWRPVPSLDALQVKTVSQIVDELAVYGLEIRIQIREKR